MLFNLIICSLYDGVVGDVTVVVDYSPPIACGVGSNLIDPIERHMVVDYVGTWC
jgi:hypothetical protein